MGHRTDASWDDETWYEWAVSLEEPGIELEDRIANLAAIRKQTLISRARAIILLAGTLGDIMRSLPPSDPWLHIDRASFGTWEDGTDIAPLEQSNIRADIGLAALARPLSRESVELLAQAAEGWEFVARAAQLFDDPLPHLLSAIKWATWRRRMLENDQWPVLAASLWVGLSQRVLDGASADSDKQRMELTERAQLDDTYL